MSLISKTVSFLLLATAIVHSAFAFQTLFQEDTQVADGCSEGNNGDLSKPQWIISSRVCRQFLIHVPESYDPTKPTGLILSFHGYGKDMFNQQEISRLNDSTHNSDMIAVFPQGRIGTNGSSAWEGVPRAEIGVNDLAFTSNIVSYMQQKFNIDTTKIYACGKSDGGGFVGTLACSAEHGGAFAAFAAVSGAFYTDADNTSGCSPARSPMPMLEFHGGMDDVIPYHGGNRHSASLPAIPDWLARWAGPIRDNCLSSRTVRDSKVLHKTYSSCSGNDDDNNSPASVQGYLIHSLGHVWPSMSANDDNKGSEDEFATIEATDIIMEFFRQNPLVVKGADSTSDEGRLDVRMKL